MIAAISAVSASIHVNCPGRSKPRFTCCSLSGSLILKMIPARQIGKFTKKIIRQLLIHISSWRMIFFVNLPICLAGIIFSIRLPDNEQQVKRGFDLPGQFTWMLALTALIAAIIEWHHLGGEHPLIYGGLIFSAFMLIIFFWI